jgi:hypothetical protein
VLTASLLLYYLFFLFSFPSSLALATGLLFLVHMLCRALLAMAIACAAALPLCALLLVLVVDARVLLLLFLLLALLALAIVTLAMPVLAIFTKFLLCASILVAMLARIQVYSCKIPWLGYSVQFLHICKCQCLWAGSLCSNS